jgi:hypothetical protein
MPTDVADSSRAAQQTVDHELSSEMFSQGIAGAIVLAIIYVITQALGFFQAFGSSFIGDGKNAHRQTFGHTSFQSYQAKHIKPALDRGNMRLTELRSHLGREVPKYREDVSKVSCSDYYRRKVEEETALTPAARHTRQTDAAPVSPAVGQRAQQSSPQESVNVVQAAEAPCSSATSHESRNVFSMSPTRNAAR